MKKLKYLAIAGALLMSLNGYSQGNVTFANDGTTLIRNVLTGAAVGSGQIRVGLYYNANLTAEANPDAPRDGWIQAGAFANVGIPLAGTFSGGTRNIPTVDAASGTVQVQVRAWSAAFATYEAAYDAGLAGQSVLVGASNTMFIRPTVAPAPTPGILSAGLLGFSVSPVPEPSMIALSLLGGLGAMVLLRRRK